MNYDKPPTEDVENIGELDAPTFEEFLQHPRTKIAIEHGDTTVYETDRDSQVMVTRPRITRRRDSTRYRFVLDIIDPVDRGSNDDGDDETVRLRDAEW